MRTKLIWAGLVEKEIWAGTKEQSEPERRNSRQVGQGGGEAAWGGGGRRSPSKEGEMPVF